MATSKYDRELRFIETETRHLTAKLDSLRDTMPADPAEANRKAEEVLAIEARIGDLLRRRREIEDSYIAAGMDIPDSSRNLNANVWREGRGYDSTGYKETPERPPVRPEGTVEELTAEIESVTDELMGIEVRMLRADMNGDEDERQKLSMMASSLRSRRDSLVEQVKLLRAEAEKPPEEEPRAPDASEMEMRIQELERDNRAIRAQLSDVRSDIGDVKESLRQILDAMGLDP